LINRLKINYLIIPLFVLITASAASYFADIGMVWYRTINLPSWTPSNTLMVIMWTIIFILGALSILIIWNKYSTQKHFGVIISLFVFNGLLIVGWNILFFSQQQMGLAFFQALLLIADLTFLIFLIWPFCKIAASLLVPYSVWVIFATVLTLNVWMIN
jgi:tryptophan-rich sensory protein